MNHRFVKCALSQCHVAWCAYHLESVRLCTVVERICTKFLGTSGIAKRDWGPPFLPGLHSWGTLHRPLQVGGCWCAPFSGEEIVACRRRWQRQVLGARVDLGPKRVVLVAGWGWRSKGASAQRMHLLLANLAKSAGPKKNCKTCSGDSCIKCGRTSWAGVHFIRCIKYYPCLSSDCYT